MTSATESSGASASGGLPSGRKRFFIHCQHDGERILKIIGKDASVSIGEARTPAETCRARTPEDMMEKPLRAMPTSPQAQQKQEDRLKKILAA